jgi:hypothetical protein
MTWEPTAWTPPKEEEVLELGRCPDCEKWMDDCICCPYCGDPDCEAYNCLKEES